MKILHPSSAVIYLLPLSRLSSEWVYDLLFIIVINNLITCDIDIKLLFYVIW